MKKINIFLAVLIVLLLPLIVSCFVSKEKYDLAVSENAQLKEDLIKIEHNFNQLQARLDEIESDPQRLFAKLEQAYLEDNFEVAKETFAKLSEYHFDFELFPIAKTMYEQTVTRENALKAEQERIKREQEEAERLAKERAEREKYAAVDRLSKRHDDISNVTWYNHTEFTHNMNTYLTSLYMGQTEKIVFLRLLMTYAGPDWIFFDRAYLSYDGNTLEIKFDKYNNKKTEVLYGGRICEWIDVLVNEEDLQFLKDFSRATEPKMRFSGKYTKTRTLSAKEINGLRDILNAYDVLKETPR